MKDVLLGKDATAAQNPHEYVEYPVLAVEVLPDSPAVVAPWIRMTESEFRQHIATNYNEYVDLFLTPTRAAQA
jgi:hypothetical protein